MANDLDCNSLGVLAGQGVFGIWAGTGGILLLLYPRVFGRAGTGRVLLLWYPHPRTG